MPFVRISLLRGKPLDYLEGLQAAAHDALVEAFGMPPDDSFGIIDQYEPHELLFHRTFRTSGHRSDDFVIFTITDGVDRGEPAKRHFYKLLVDLAAKRPGVRPEDVFVMIHMETRLNFSFGEGVSGVETFDREVLDRAATTPGTRDAWTNEEIVSAVSAFFADDDGSALLPMLSDDVILSTPASLPHGGDITGRTEVEAFLARVAEGDSRPTLDRVIDAGNQVIAQITVETAGSTAENSSPAANAWIFDLAGGRIVRAQLYAATAARADSHG